VLDWSVAGLAFPVTETCGVFVRFIAHLPTVSIIGGLCWCSLFVLDWMLGIW
jgi:hypothetical protein